jgi:MSHA pilin protein MshA
MRNKKGFTLIELVMIIVVLGILAAVAIPRFYDLGTEARNAVVDGAFGAVGGQMQISYAQYRVYPTSATFAASVLANISRNGWSYTTPTVAAPLATFSIVSGTTPVTGTDRGAAASYNDTTFALSIGAKVPY